MKKLTNLKYLNILITILAMVSITSCFDVNLNNSCKTEWEGNKLVIDSIYSKQWENGNGKGLIVRNMQSIPNRVSNVMVVFYNCSSESCVQSSAKEFDFDTDPYLWSENGVMPERWTITLLSLDRFAYRTSIGAGCTENYEISRKQFTDK